MLEKLKHIPLFEGVNRDILEPLIKGHQIYEKSYNKGITIHEQHSNCLGMDIVLTGGLVAYSLASNGSETIVFQFGQGNIIGANLIFGEESKYPMNIYSTSNCTVLHIVKPAVKELLRNYSFVMGFVKSLSHNSLGMNKKIAMYTQKTLRENLLDYFIALSSIQASKTISLSITKKQLADYFSVQRPSLFRELKKMKEEGLIEVDKQIITLKF